MDILRIFAYYNKTISYCQGMNYIAGYLLVLIQNESDAYKLFHIVMNTYFANILTDSFNQLKVMFYQFDKCLSIFLSEIHQKLNVTACANSPRTRFFDCPARRLLTALPAHPPRRLLTCANRLSPPAYRMKTSTRPTSPCRGSSRSSRQRISTR